MHNPRCPRFFLPCLAAAAALGAVLTGCDTPFAVSNTTILVPVAGGQKVEVTYGKNGVVMKEKDGVQMGAATLDLSTDRKHLVYLFKISFKNGVVPQHVTIVDLTDDPVQTVVEDRAPRLKDGQWVAARVDRDINDPTLAWLKTVDDSMQIYRVTVTLVDGTQVVMDQPVSYPGFIKAAMRKTIGLDY
jgi:hypothetical protein